MMENGEYSVERHITSIDVYNADEALQKVREHEIHYPILVLPWGEHSGAAQYITNNDDELCAAVARALEDAIHETRVHLISKYGHPGNWSSRTIENPPQT